MKKIKKYIAAALIGFINGFFASGGGIVAVLALRRLMDMDEKRAHACAIGIILPLSLVGIVFYTHGGYADKKTILLTSLGGIAGAAAGAKLLQKMKKEYISLFFGIIMVIAAARMFFV